MGRVISKGDPTTSVAGRIWALGEGIGGEHVPEAGITCFFPLKNEKDHLFLWRRFTNNNAREEVLTTRTFAARE